MQLLSISSSQIFSTSVADFRAILLLSWGKKESSCCKPRCSKLELMLGKDMPNFRGHKKKKLICVSGKVGLLQLASCPVDRVSGASTVSWPPPAMKRWLHTAVFQPLLVHSGLLPRVIPYPSFLIHCIQIFITALQLYLTGAHSLCLFNRWLKMCQSPFTSLLLLVYPLLYTQAFRCHPVVSCLSSFFPHVAGPTALSSLTLTLPSLSTLMFHVLNPSSVTSLQTLLNFPVASYTALRSHSQVAQ